MCMILPGMIGYHTALQTLVEELDQNQVLVVDSGFVVITSAWEDGIIC